MTIERIRKKRVYSMLLLMMAKPLCTLQAVAGMLGDSNRPHRFYQTYGAKLVSKIPQIDIDKVPQGTSDCNRTFFVLRVHIDGHSEFRGSLFCKNL